MKIAVMAAGGVGGYFGARLAAAGYDVTFVARGPHLEAMRQGGLKVESALGDLRLSPVNATDDPGAIGPVDVVMFAVKLWDTEEAAAACKPLLGDGTAVISFLNGVESVDVALVHLQHQPRNATGRGRGEVSGVGCAVAEKNQITQQLGRET